MTSGKRHRLPPEERRAQLLDLGRRMLAERTLDELSIEDLAEAAGVSRGLLFHYFAGKADFHLQVARAAAEDLLARTEPDPAWAPEEALTRSVEAFVDYVEENPQGYVALLRGSGSGDAALDLVFDRTRDRLAQRTVEVMTSLGLDLPPSAVMAVRGWIAYVEDVTVNWCTAGPTSAPLTREELVDLLVRGLPALVMGLPLRAPGHDEPVAGAAKVGGGQGRA